MTALPANLRKQLEKTILAAREVAEAGAVAALNAMAVGAPRFHEHMSADDRLLRNRLRAHGRTLGDHLRDDDTQELTRLAREVAYEHWHRMLFARFLAENSLLIHDEHQVPVSLQDVEEFAAEERTDVWTLAGRFASKMLPQVFRPDDPALALRFAAEHQKAMEGLLEALSADVFTTSDAMGWGYEYWQIERKKEVESRLKSGGKVGADDLGAKTQYFTENYMVRFLLHNTVGAWWAARKCGTGVPPVELQTEEALRAWTAEGLGGYQFEYLRFVAIDSEHSRDGCATLVFEPAAGTFPGWPRTAKELRVLDPCCGSGHFLVEVFDLLVRLRMVEEGLTARDAVDAVLSENLYGLELDPRCTQIAAFALAMAAWRFECSTAVSAVHVGEKHTGGTPVPHSGYRELPRLNIACSGLGISGKREDWIKLAGGSHKLEFAMDQLYGLFRNAPTLGSLIDPGRQFQEFVSLDEATGLLAEALSKEKSHLDFDTAERGVAAQGLADAARLLAGRYTLVITNVPYLARGKQDETLKDYIETHHDRAKADIATAFVERGLRFCSTGGTTALVTPQNWLFLGSYKKLREELLKSATWDIVGKLGAKGFQTPMWDFNVMLIGLTNAKPGAGHELRGLDASEPRKPEEKAAMLRGDHQCGTGVSPVGLELSTIGSEKHTGGTPVPHSHSNIQSVSQKDQLANPDARVVLGLDQDGRLFSECCDSYIGFQNGDTPRFVMSFWEVPFPGNTWNFFQLTTDRIEEFWGREAILQWDGGTGALMEYALVKGTSAWSKRGVLVRLVGDLPCSLYSGHFYDQSSAALIPRDPVDLPAIWCFCSSPDFNEAVREIDQALKVTNSTLVKIPFDLAHWQAIAAEKYPNGLPEPYSDDPTQWIFHGRVTPSEAPLQVALARLLGYRWPEETKCGTGVPPVMAHDSEQALRNANDNTAETAVPHSLPHSIQKSRRNLPHWYREGATYFVTFRLADSMPAPVLAQWKREQEEWLVANPEPHSDAQRHEYLNVFNEKRQAYFDAGHGACILRDAAMGQIVESALRHFDGERYDLGDFVIMPNHVHVLMTPSEGHGLSEILHSWKSFTAHAINKRREAQGAVWQDESFDHIVRSEAQLEHFQRYIAENPAKAGLKSCFVLKCGTGVPPVKAHDSEQALGNANNNTAETAVPHSFGDDALTDEDGIICLVRVRGEDAAADRLRGFLASAYGAEWSPQREQQLLADVGFGGRTLEEWLREGFFEQHLKLFHQTPFLWHVWDGLADGFAALINYHRLDARRLEILTYSYLGDWIAAQRDAAKRNVSGADRKLIAAEALQAELKKITDGEPPYDIFVRWKPLKDQPIGWQPDLNDGVRMNIRPWMVAAIPGAALGRAKPVGILRRKPNIKWGTDRGTEPERPIEDYPWFWDARGEKFVGDRVNDRHLTRAEKETARRGKNVKGEG
ncbi:hypothetical protein GC173_16590 [bacterium]|nr:hypothetical protein [bacterium]